MECFVLPINLCINLIFSDRDSLIILSIFKDIFVQNLDFAILVENVHVYSAIIASVARKMNSDIVGVDKVCPRVNINAWADSLHGPIAYMRRTQLHIQRRYECFTRSVR